MNRFNASLNRASLRWLVCCVLLTVSAVAFGQPKPLGSAAVDPSATAVEVSVDEASPPTK